MCHLHLKLCTPAGRTILDPVTVLLSVLAFQVDCHAENHRTGYADQQVRGMETEPRGGKRCREAVPNGKQLAREVSTGRKPESLCQLNLESNSGRRNLVRNIVKQYEQRLMHLPEGSKQSVQIDLRGQNVSDEVLTKLC